MPVIVSLEGSEEDFAKLLILHQVISQDQLAKALESRQSASAKSGAVEPLRDTLLRVGFVSSSLIFEVLRVASKVVEQCTKCGAIHHIYFYHPHARFFCAYCKGPLKVTDPGQALKWSPGQLAAAAAKASAAGGPPPSVTQIIRRANPLDEPSVAALPAADETMLDMGLTARSKSAKAAVPAPKPAALPPQTPKAPIDPTVTILPVYGDETMLDMGSTPKAKPVKPAAPAAASPPPPSKPAPLPDQTIVPSSMGDETMLDMGSTPRPKALTPPAATAAEPRPAAAPPPPVPRPARFDQTIVPSSVGDETMLDMGETPKSKSMKPATPAPAPPDQSVRPSALSDETVLDMPDSPKPGTPADRSDAILSEIGR